MDATPRKAYPRAIPHRSPEEIAAQTQRLRDDMHKLATDSARQRRWNYALSATLALVVVLGVAVTLYLKTPGSGNPVGATEPSPPPAVQPQYKGPAARAKPSGDLPQAAQQGAMLESLGGLSAANLYQSYLNIGLLADGVESKTFTIEGGASTLKIITNCLTLVDNKLAKLDKESLDPEDQGSLARIRAVTELLRIQARDLLAYWLTGGPVQSAQYQFARQASWKGLSQVLGIDGE